MSKKHRVFILAGMGLLLLLVSSVSSQIIYGQQAFGKIGGIYSHWSLDDGKNTTEINQYALPLTGYMPLGENTEAYVYLANSSNTLTESREDYTLSGLGDVRFQLNRSFAEDKYVVSVGVNLPTGKKNLTLDEELPVLQMLSQNYLTFPLRRFGEGLGFNLLFGTAFLLGELRCGTGIAYQYTGSYEPYENSASYNPGDFISINAGADWNNEKTSFAGDIIYTTYTDDKSGDRKIYKQSDQVNIRLKTTHRTPSLTFHSQLEYFRRGEYTFYNPQEERRVYGNELFFYLDASHHSPDGWDLAPLMELKLVGANDDASMGGAHVLGLGAMLGRLFTPQVSGGISGTYYTGSADDGDISISGLQVNVHITARVQ